jgi:hypothetical protein
VLLTTTTSKDRLVGEPGWEVEPSLELLELLKDALEALDMEAVSLISPSAEGLGAEVPAAASATLTSVGAVLLDTEVLEGGTWRPESEPMFWPLRNVAQKRCVGSETSVMHFISMVPTDLGGARRVSA